MEQAIIPDRYDINNAYFRKKSLDVMFDKQYYVTVCSDLYIINIKGMHDKIYIYVYDVSKNNKILVHIFDVNKNIKRLEKYVQISHNLKLLSIPDDDFLYIFSVDELVHDNVLKIYDGGIRLDLTHSIPIVHKKSIIDTTVPSHRVSVDSIQEPYKCILYNDKYVIICTIDNKISAVIIYNFEKQDTKILDIDKDTTSPYIFFSENGKYLMTHTKNQLCVVNINTEKTKLIILSKQLCDTLYQNTFSISDDGELITVLNDSGIVLINSTSQIDKYSIDKQFGNLKDASMNIINNSDDINKINVITLWNKKLHKILILTMIYNNGYILTKKYIAINIRDELDVLYTNGHLYVYKFDEYINVYDIDKTISLNILNSLLDILSINLDKFGTQNMQLNVIGFSNNDTYTVKKWVFDMLGANIDLSKHSNLIDSIIFKNKKGNNMNLFQIFLGLIHNHKLTDEYLNCVLSEESYEEKTELIILALLRLTEMLTVLCKNDTIVNLSGYYIEYLLIKIGLIIYKSKSEIEPILNIYGNIKNTKQFMFCLFRTYFNLDINRYS